MAFRDNSYNKWGASPVWIEQINSLCARTLLTPEVAATSRSLSYIELVKNLNDNFVTIKVATSAKARDEVFKKLSQAYPNEAKVVDEPHMSNKQVKVPVLHITVPYERAAQALEEVNNCEDKTFKMTPQTIQRFIEMISLAAVNTLLNGLKNVSNKISW